MTTSQIQQTTTDNQQISPQIMSLDDALQVISQIHPFGVNSSPQFHFTFYQNISNETKKSQFRQAKLKPQLKPVLYQNSHVRKQSLSVSPRATGIRNYKSFVVQSVNRESSRERLHEIIKQSQKERARSIRWSVLVE